MKDLGRRMKVRSRVLRLAMVVALFAVTTRLFYVQHVDGAKLSRESASMWTNSMTIQATRGTIYDRNFEKLAYTRPAYTVYVDPSQLRIADSGKDLAPVVAQELAPILNVSSSDLGALTTLLDSGAKGWVKVSPWGNAIDEQQHAKIEKLISDLSSEYSTTDTQWVPGIYFEKTNQRVYPNGPFAANVLGFVNAQGQGGTGVEQEYQNVLQGTNGSERYLSDPAGNPLPLGKQVVQPAKDGESLQLTIDSTIQHYVEEALDQGMQKWKPVREAIIVTDPNTGEILAMGSRPSFDPNNYQSVTDPSVLYRNWAVNSTFEPGSTFKIVTLTAALQEHAISLSDTYESGHMVVGSAIVHDWNWVGWGRINYHDAFVKSSNVGFAKIALKLGAPLLYKYIDEFGFNHPTGIDLPGESNSILFPVDSILPIELATTGYGQGVAVTPIQQVAAVGAVANGGELIKPHVVKSIIDTDTGKVIKNITPDVEGHVASPEVMAQVRQAMQDEVDEDANLAAFIPGYDVAGKTGTASIPNPNGNGYLDSENRYIDSFIGFAPRNHPMVEIYVTIDTPHIDVSFGSTTAAPLAKEVLSQTLPYLHAPIDKAQLAAYNKAHPTQQTVPTTNAPTPPAATYATVPDIIGSSVSDAQAWAKNAGISLAVVGKSGVITHEWPSAGVSVTTRQHVLAMLGDGQTNGKITMPDLTGFSMSDATNILATLGLQSTVSGNGYVTHQSIAAGSAVAPGALVKLQFSSP